MEEEKTTQTEQMTTKKSIYWVIPVIAVIIISGVGFWYLQASLEKPVTPAKIIQTENKKVVPVEETIASLKFSPRVLNLSVGDKAEVGLNLDFLKEKRLDGADIILSFDPKIIEVTEIVPTKLFSFVSQRKEELAKGKVSATFLEEKGGGIRIFGSNQILTLKIKAKSAGTTNIEVVVAEKGATTVLAENNTSKIIKFTSEKVAVTVK